jgi:hypothetical protein
MAANLEFWVQGGTLVEAAGNAPFLLNQGRRAWLVLSGGVDLFAVDLADGQPAGMNFLDEWLREDWSGAAYYRAIQPTIPVSLVSERNYARILEVASQVPGACALGGFYFELGLGETEAGADISFRALPARGCPAALATHRPTAPGPGHDPWLILQRLAWKWGQPGESLHEGVAEVWLEFDIRGSRPQAPSFFSRPRPFPGRPNLRCLSKPFRRKSATRYFLPPRAARSRPWCAFCRKVSP